VVVVAAAAAAGGAAAVMAVARGEAAAVAGGLEASRRGVGEAGAACAERLGLEARRPPPGGETRRARARVPRAGGTRPRRGEAPRAASTARLRAGRSSTQAAPAHPRRQVLLDLLSSRCRDRRAAGAFGTGLPRQAPTGAAPARPGQASRALAGAPTLPARQRPACQMHPAWLRDRAGNRTIERMWTGGGRGGAREAAPQPGAAPPASGRTCPADAR